MIVDAEAKKGGDPPSLLRPPEEVDEDKTEIEGSEGVCVGGGGEDADAMHLRWHHRRHLSTIAHLTEQNDLLTRRVAILEAENEEMGDEMDYLIREIILLRFEKRGGARTHAIREVDISGGIGSLMFESLTEEGNDHDYYSYDDDEEDDVVDSDIF